MFVLEKFKMLYVLVEIGSSMSHTPGILLGTPGILLGLLEEGD